MHNSQRVYRRNGSCLDFLELPPPKHLVMPNVAWGRHDCLFTPAYWAAQAWHHQTALGRAAGRIGNTLAEEIALCVLGGHGMPAEIGLAAFRRLQRAGMLDG